MLSIPANIWMSRLPSVGVYSEGAECRRPPPPGPELGPTSGFVFRRLDHVRRHSHPETSQGSYVDWLVRVADREISARGDGASMERLLKFLQHGTGIGELERLASVATGFSVERLRGRRRELLQGDNELLRGVKLRELEDARLELFGVERGLTPTFRFKRRGTQFDAYLDDAGVCRLMKELANRSPGLLRRDEKERRIKRRDAALDGLLAAQSNDFPPTDDDLAQAYRALGDPWSSKIHAALGAGEVRVRLYRGQEFEKYVGNLVSLLQTRPIDPSSQDAVYFRAGQLGPKAVMMVRRRPLGLSPHAPAKDAFFEVLAVVAHEYQHHLDIDPRERMTPPVLFRHELAAHAREFLWRAEHGDVVPLSEFAIESKTGFAMHFLNRFEANYGAWFRRSI